MLLILDKNVISVPTPDCQRNLKQKLSYLILSNSVDPNLVGQKPGKKIKIKKAINLSLSVCLKTFLK